MYSDKSPQRHSSQRGSDIHIVEAQAYCLPMELASLLKVTFGFFVSFTVTYTASTSLTWWCCLTMTLRLRRLYMEYDMDFALDDDWWEKICYSYEIPLRNQYGTMTSTMTFNTIKYIHLNFIHRNIKPDNFLIGIGKRGNQVNVIDSSMTSRPIFTYLTERTRMSLELHATPPAISNQSD